MTVRELLEALETEGARGNAKKCLLIGRQLGERLLCPLHPKDPVHFCASCRGGRGGQATSPKKTRAARRNAKRPRPREAQTL